MQRIPHKPVVAITVGDFNGIGPEVALKSLMLPKVWDVCQPLLVGPRQVFEYYAARYRLPFALPSDNPEATFFHTEDVNQKEIHPGKLSRRAGLVAANAIEAAVKLVQQRRADAIVTAPVSKKALHMAGIKFPGQTEMVQRMSGSKQVAMMLVSDTMRVGLVTIHIPLRDVAGMLTRLILREKIGIVYAALKQDWKIRNPKIAVLGLNPHAGENGDIGKEDATVIAPVVKEFRRRKIRVDGPFPADSFFGKYKPGMYDAVVAMYHDQGLIPLKMSSFGKGINISVGLNIVRTSPDHGTAFDIAGKGIANPGSMVEAIKLAAFVATNRNRKRKSS